MCLLGEVKSPATQPEQHVDLSWFCKSRLHSGWFLRSDPFLSGSPSIPLPGFRVGGMNSFAVDVDSRTFHLELAALAFGIKHSCKESRLWKTVDGVNIVS